MLKVTTIFYSVQGEATHTGIPSIFIRLHGCNLDCSFCDDLLHKEDYTNVSYEQVLEEIKAYPSNQVIITGGEPTLNDLNPFIDYLHEHRYHVSIETNGFNLEYVAKADWITYSPKDWSKILTQGYNELKVVVNKNSDISNLIAFQTDKPFFIQPENYFDTPNMDNIKHCIELVKQHPKFRLGIQTHKFLGVP